MNVVDGIDYDDIVDVLVAVYIVFDIIVVDFMLLIMLFRCCCWNWLWWYCWYYWDFESFQKTWLTDWVSEKVTTREAITSKKDTQSISLSKNICIVWI